MNKKLAINRWPKQDIAEALENDRRLHHFLEEAKPVLKNFDALYLCRGALRDYLTDAVPEDYDVMPIYGAHSLDAIARSLGCTRRTYFGGYRRLDPDGLQIDVFIPHGFDLSAHDSDTVLRAMDTFAFSCDAMAVNLISGNFIARPSVLKSFREGVFSIQPAYLDQCADVDLAYAAIKAVWIMGQCNLQIDKSQIALLSRGFQLVLSGERRFLGPLFKKIRQIDEATEFLRSQPPLRVSYRRAESDFWAQSRV